MMIKKKSPERMCAGCKKRGAKKELIRVARGPDGGIALDLTGKKPGRGVYICPKGECLRLARKAKRLERSLGCAIPDGVYDALEEELRKSEV